MIVMTRVGKWGGGKEEMNNNAWIAQLLTDITLISLLSKFKKKGLKWSKSCTLFMTQNVLTETSVRGPSHCGLPHRMDHITNRIHKVSDLTNQTSQHGLPHQVDHLTQWDARSFDQITDTTSYYGSYLSSNVSAWSCPAMCS